MKKNIWLLVIVMVAVTTFLISCGEKKQEAHHDDAADWKEMDEFHMLMAESFHPYKDSANLEPAKANAVAMADYAEQWSKSPLPSKVDRDDVKQKLNSLSAGCKEFVTVVNAGDTNAIGESLNDIHDRFHAVQEAWYGGGSGHHHEH